MAIIAITRVTDVGRRPANRSCGADGPRGASRRRDVAIGEVRRLIQRYRQPFINEATTEAGRDALGYYHERRDENRNVGLGPEHAGRATLPMRLAISRSATRNGR